MIQQKIKLSLITITKNSLETIACTVNSLNSQSYKNIERVWIDGVSDDGTYEYLAKEASLGNDVLVSELDAGIYDALNKGIRKSTGDIIGILHSDDFLADNDILSKVASIFEDSSIDVVYGDLYYISRKNSNLVRRKWVAGKFSYPQLKFGWMPPHPTVFIRRHIFDKYGLYDTSYSIAADYEFLLRILSKKEVNITYIPLVITKMRLGGESNKSIAKMIQKSLEDYRAIRTNNIGGLMTLVFKNLRKIPQFF